MSIAAISILLQAAFPARYTIGIHHSNGVATKLNIHAEMKSPEDSRGLVSAVAATLRTLEIMPERVTVDVTKQGAKYSASFSVFY